MQTAVNQSYAAHRSRFRIAIFEAAGAGKLGGQGGEQERGVVLGGQLDGLLALVLGDLDVGRHVVCRVDGADDPLSTDLATALFPLVVFSLLPTRAPLLARSLSVLLFLSLSFSLAHSLSSVSPNVSAFDTFLPRVSPVSPRARKGEYEEFKTRLKYSRNTTNTHALRSLAPSHATPHLCLSALLPRHGGAASSATGTPCPRYGLSKEEFRPAIPIIRQKDTENAIIKKETRTRIAARNSPAILSLRRSPRVAHGTS